MRFHVSQNEGKRTGYDLLMSGFTCRMRLSERVMTCSGVVSKDEGKRTGYDLLRYGFTEWGKENGDDLFRSGFKCRLRLSERVMPWSGVVSYTVQWGHRKLVMTYSGVVSKNEVKRTGYDLLRCGFIEWG
jgi:hypothetical protein